MLTSSFRVSSFLDFFLCCDLSAPFFVWCSSLLPFFDLKDFSTAFPSITRSQNCSTFVVSTFSTSRLRFLFNDLSRPFDIGALEFSPSLLFDSFFLVCVCVATDEVTDHPGSENMI